MNGEGSQLTTWIALLVIGAGVVLFLVFSRRFIKNRQEGQALLKGLGFVHASPDRALEARFSNLYRNRYAFFRELYQRRLPDGVLYIFSLYNPDGVIVSRGIAIISGNLSLPSLKIFPKIDPNQFGLGSLANQIIERVVSTADEKVELQEFPDFNKKYQLFSGDQEGVRRFFNDRIADYFSRTAFFTILAEGDMFVFEDYSPSSNKNNLSLLSQNIRQAIEILNLFQRK